MSYGELKIDTITFTAGGVDSSISVSGLVQNPTFTGNLTTTGTISGDVVRGNTVSGATVTGGAGEFGTITGNTAGFTTVTGTTVTGTTANFVTLSGTTVTGNTGQFTNITGVNIVGTTEISGATVTGDVGRFTTITGGTHTLTSGVFASGTAANPSITFVDDLDTGLFTGAANTVSLVANGAAVLTASGTNVGVGTTSPENNLHIFTDTNGEGILVKSTGNSSNSLDFDANRTAAEGGIGAIRGKWNGTTVAQISFNTGSDTTNKDDGFISFGTESAASSGNANAAEKMRIDSAGRVGIGTSSPGSFVSIQNVSAGSYAGTTSTAGANGLDIFNAQTTNDDSFAAISLRASRSTGNAAVGSINLVATGSGSGSFAFVTRNADVFGERMRITHDGKVGIGTTSPGTPLTVQANTNAESLRLLGRSSDDRADIQFYENDASTFTGSLSFETNSANFFLGSGSGELKLTANQIAFRSEIGTEQARIDSSGRVGIGTTSPGSFNGEADNLVISGTGDVGITIDATSSTNSNIYFADGPTGSEAYRGVIRYEHSTDAMRFWTAAGERVRITNSGQLRFTSGGGNEIVFEDATGRIYFNNSTNASIGSSSAGGGSTTLYIGNAAIQVSSDARLKENIEDTNLDALDAISQIKVKDFTWNDPSDTSPNNRNARGTWTGLIAQELVEVLPFVVNAPRNEDDGSIDHDSEDIWTLDQSQLCPVLIKAMQQQQEIIASLEARLSALEAQ